MPVISPRLVQEKVMLPGLFRNADGSTYIASLEAIIIRPDDDQRHPLAVINHGYDPVRYRDIYVDELRSRAMEFARRGWVAVAFSRRGYGNSGGHFVEGVGGCNVASFIRAGLVPAADIREVIRLMAQAPYVDGSTVISVGVSGGGYATLALTSVPTPGLVAAINFAGVVRTVDPQKRLCYHNNLLKAVTLFGQRSRVPMLWVYAENDSVSPLVLGQQMYRVFSAAGGNAEFIAAPSFGEEGHLLFKEGFSIWTPYLDAFLRRHGLQQGTALMSLDNVRTVVPGNMP